MSRRSEEAALKMYPVMDYNKEPNYIHICGTKMLDEVYREVFKFGYEQAEKDLALTWEDIKMIHDIFIDLADDEDFAPLSNEFYEEVLRRFREMKNK